MFPFNEVGFFPLEKQPLRRVDFSEWLPQLTPRLKMGQREGRFGAWSLEVGSGSWRSLAFTL